MSREIVRSLALELGLQYEFISDPKHVVHQNRDCRDPDVVYLVDPGLGFFSPHDAVLYFQCETRFIRWHLTSKAKIRKILVKTNDECYVCCDTSTFTKECPGCRCEICEACMLKMGLNPKNSLHFSKGNFAMEFQCPRCSEWIEQADVRDLYIKILDRKDEFTKDQQDILLFLKDTDKSFERHFAVYKREQNWGIDMRSKQFKQGMKVEICGLKEAKWNGKKAAIVGDRIEENEALQWPIQFTDGSNRSMLVKQCNMRKIGVRFWRKDKRPEFVRKRLRIEEDPEEPDLDNLWSDDSDGE